MITNLQEAKNHLYIAMNKIDREIDREINIAKNKQLDNISEKINRVIYQLEEVEDKEKNEEKGE